MPRSKTFLLKLSNITPNTLLHFGNGSYNLSHSFCREHLGFWKKRKVDVSKKCDQEDEQKEKGPRGGGVSHAPPLRRRRDCENFTILGHAFLRSLLTQKNALKNYTEDCLEQQDLSTTLSVNGRSPCPSLPEVCYVVQNEDSLRRKTLKNGNGKKVFLSKADSLHFSIFYSSGPREFGDHFYYMLSTELFSFFFFI